jgi:histidinol-phosphate aminotransferase
LHPKPKVESLEVGEHGGLNYAELEGMDITPGEVLDFSVSSNPFGPPPGIGEAFSPSAIDRYPDREATELRRHLAGKLGITPQNIIAGNGSVELLRLAALAYFGSGDRVLIIEPTFGEYEVACRIAGSQPLKQWTGADGFKVREIVDLITQERPKGVFLCNPNNPTGQYLPRWDFQQILAACEDTLLVLDEAYIAFVDRAWSSLEMIQGGNLIILRSMTKDYALAGLRLGYAISHPGVIEALRKVCPPWNVNAVAQRAGVLALEQEDYLEQCKIKLQQSKDFLMRGLTDLGLPPLSSEANFFLVEVGDAGKLRQQLLKRGILIRDCTSFGLPDYIRVAPRTMPEGQKLIAAIKEIRSTSELIH